MADEEQNKSDLIKEFCNVTGIESQRAQLYLESSAWELELAIANFYEDTDESLEQVPVPVVTEERNSPTHSTPSELPPMPSAPSFANRFATLSSILKDDNSDDEGQAFYAGGSERSGQQVLGPGKKKKDKSDLVTEMFKAAKEHGAQILEPNDTSRRASSSAFRGTGYKLGSDENTSAVVRGNSSSEAEKSVEMSLKMWKNGFSIDDGPLREYTDPRNIVFLESIKKGEIPEELYQQARGEVNLNMEDHQHQDYQLSTGRVNAFGGEGHRLGNLAPTVTALRPKLPTSPEESKSNECHAQKLLDIDQNEPTTSIQIRLADGSRLIAKLNVTHTVGDIRNYIITARPQFENSSFSLLTTFPNKELTDNSSSIKDANLLNAVIVQKMN